jgi:hypothetical protein
MTKGSESTSANATRRASSFCDFAMAYAAILPPNSNPTEFLIHYGTAPGSAATGDAS